MRIFIASADDKLRLALQLFLDDEPGMVVVGLSDRLKGLLAQLKVSESNVLLLDWVFPVQSITDLFTDLNKLEHKPTIVVFSNRPEEKEMVMAAGADYFTTKDAPPDKLIPILNEIRSSLIHYKHSQKYKEKRL